MTDDFDPSEDDGPTLEEAKAAAAELPFTPVAGTDDLPTDVRDGVIEEVED